MSLCSYVLYYRSKTRYQYRSNARYIDSMFHSVFQTKFNFKVIHDFQKKLWNNRFLSQNTGDRSMIFPSIIFILQFGHWILCDMIISFHTILNIYLRLVLRPTIFQTQFKLFIFISISSTHISLSYSLDWLKC